MIKAAPIALAVVVATSSEAESTCCTRHRPPTSNPPHALVRQQRNPLVRLWSGLSNFAEPIAVSGV